MEIAEKFKVQVQKYHLSKVASGRPKTSLCELIWNAFDDLRSGAAPFGPGAARGKPAPAQAGRAPSIWGRPDPHPSRGPGPWVGGPQARSDKGALRLSQRDRAGRAFEFHWHCKPVECRSWVRHPCFVIQVKTDENQSELSPELPLKDKKEAECQDQCLFAHGQQGVYSSYTHYTYLFLPFDFLVWNFFSHHAAIEGSPKYNCCMKSDKSPKFLNKHKQVQ